MLRMLLLIVMVVFVQCGQYVSQNSPSNEALKLSPVENAEFCHVLKHSNDFDGKEIETTAILVAGFESALMYDARCIDKKKSVWFDIDSESANEQLGKYLGRQTPEFTTTGLERVRGKFVGTFQVKKNRGFGHMNLSEYRFVIKTADELSAVPAETPFPGNEGGIGNRTTPCHVRKTAICGKLAGSQSFRCFLICAQDNAGSSLML